MTFDVNEYLHRRHAETFAAMSLKLQMWTTKEFGDLVIPGSVVCKDGFTISVQASGSHYCAPRSSVGPWVMVECGFPSGDVPTLSAWKDGGESDTGSVFGWVPVEVVEALIDSHGGETIP